MHIDARISVFQPTSAAKADAHNVLPQPDGPVNKMPAQHQIGCVMGNMKDCITAHLLEICCVCQNSTPDVAATPRLCMASGFENCRTINLWRAAFVAL